MWRLKSTLKEQQHTIQKCLLNILEPSKHAWVLGLMQGWLFVLIFTFFGRWLVPVIFLVGFLDSNGNQRTALLRLTEPLQSLPAAKEMLKQFNDVKRSLNVNWLDWETAPCDLNFFLKFEKSIWMILWFLFDVLLMFVTSFCLERSKLKQYLCLENGHLFFHYKHCENHTFDVNVMKTLRPSRFDQDGELQNHPQIHQYS